MSQNPTISVLMPVYNTEKYLAKSIESILTQTFTDFEFLIVDDGSTDNSSAIIQSYATLDPRVRPISQNNQGVSQALNAGLALAQGEFIARMDGDDIALPTRFERQLHFLRQNRDIGIVGCICPLIDDNDALIRHQAYFPGSGSFFLKWRMLFAGPVPHPATMLRAVILRGKEAYKAGISAQDYELWLRLSQTVLFDNIPEPLLLYRQHAQSVTVTKQQQQINDASRTRQIHLKEVYDIEISLSESIALQTGVTESQEQAIEISHLIKKLWITFNERNPSIPPIEYGKMHEEYLRRVHRIWKTRNQPLMTLRFIKWKDIKQLGKSAPPILARDFLRMAQTQKLKFRIFSLACL